MNAKSASSHFYISAPTSSFDSNSFGNLNGGWTKDISQLVLRVHQGQILQSRGSLPWAVQRERDDPKRKSMHKAQLSYTCIMVAQNSWRNQEPKPNLTRSISILVQCLVWLKSKENKINTFSLILELTKLWTQTDLNHWPNLTNLL